jgi:hypothetical protein
MVKGHAELGLLLQMAGVTKLRLGFYQQMFLHLCVMRRMAGNTGHIVLRMQGIDGLHVFGTRGVAAETAAVDALDGSVLESENLGLVSGAFDVFLARPVTRFAALVGEAFLGV